MAPIKHPAGAPIVSEQTEQQGDMTPELAQGVERVLAMGAVAAGVAHDFNNLLVSILGFAALGRSVPVADDSARRLRAYFGEIEQAGQRAQALVQQLTALARDVPERTGLAPLAVLVREVVGDHAASFAAGVRLSIEIGDDLPAPAVTRAHVQRILVNLCRNAREATIGPGSVVVSAKSVRPEPEETCASCRQAIAGDFVRLAVRDSGPGIALAIRARVFEPFFTTRQAAGAIGLGLTAVHALAHLNGGHVQIVSPPDQGCELAVFLPVAREGAALG